MNRIKQWLLGLRRNIFGTKKLSKVYKQWKATYTTEFQVVMIDKEVLCSDITESITKWEYWDWTEEKLNQHDPFVEIINRAFVTGVIQLYDKGNKYNTSVNTHNIKKILYKQPVVMIELIKDI